MRGAVPCVEDEEVRRWGALSVLELMTVAGTHVASGVILSDDDLTLFSRRGWAACAQLQVKVTRVWWGGCCRPGPMSTRPALTTGRHRATLLQREANRP